MNGSVLRHKLLSAIIGCVTAIVVSSCATTDTGEEAAPPSTGRAAAVEQVPPVTDHSASETTDTTVEESAPVPASPTAAPEQSPVAAVNPQADGKAGEPPVADTEGDRGAGQSQTGEAEAVAAEPVAAEPAPEAEKEMPLPEDIPPNTFYVTSGPKDRTHMYYGIGSDKGLIVNGVQGKELVVVRGQSYTFNVDTDIKHDFYLSTSPRGWGAATLTDGVEGNFTYHGIVNFSPDQDTPDVVYYECRNHKYMGGKIHVINPGEEDSVVFGVRDEAPSTRERPKVDSAFTGNGTQAKQKVMFAEMMISMSPSAKRIDASDNDRARQLLAEARKLLDRAKSEQAAGNDAAAIETVNEALRNMTEASQLVPSDSQLAELRGNYDELLHAVQTYEKSYRRNLKLMQKKGKKDLPDLDIDKVSETITEAMKLADDDRLVEANQLLSGLQRTITGALTKLLAEETMDYTLTFETPKEEYEYELARYKSYEELIPIAIEQKRPSKQSRALMDSFVDKAKGIYELSGPKAGEGDYTTAIQMLQGATSHLQRALRIVGVR